MSGCLQNSVGEKSKRFWTRSPQPQLLPERSAFSDKTQPLEVQRPGRVFHNAGILVLWRVLGLDPRPSIYCVPCSGCQKTFFIYISVIWSASLRPRSTEACGKRSIVESQKTTLGDRDLLPQRSFSFNIKHWGNRWVRIRAFYDVFFKVGFNLRRTLASPD